MTDTSGFRGYALLIVMGAIRIPSSGYYEVEDVAYELTYQLRTYGRALPVAEVTRIKYDLAIWATDPVKPWTITHLDATITVRLAEKFVGWGPDMRPL